MCDSLRVCARAELYRKPSCVHRHRQHMFALTLRPDTRRENIMPSQTKGSRRKRKAAISLVLAGGPSVSRCETVTVRFPLRPASN